MTTIALHDSVRLAAPSRPARPVATRRARLTRRGRIVFGTLIALPLLAAAYLFGLGASQAGADSTRSTVSFEQVTVMPGDTLWSIAADIAPNSDPQEVVSQLTSLNQLGSQTVQPGQRLAIPVEFSH